MSQSKACQQLIRERTLNASLRRLSSKWTAARQITLDRLEALRECLQTDTCTLAQKTVVIGGSFHFGGAASGSVSGEDIW